MSCKSEPGGGIEHGPKIKRRALKQPLSQSQLSRSAPIGNASALTDGSSGFRIAANACELTHAIRDPSHISTSPAGFIKGLCGAIQGFRDLNEQLMRNRTAKTNNEPAIVITEIAQSYALQTNPVYVRLEMNSTMIMIQQQQQQQQQPTENENDNNNNEMDTENDNNNHSGGHIIERERI